MNGFYPSEFGSSVMTFGESDVNDHITFRTWSDKGYIQGEVKNEGNEPRAIDELIIYEGSFQYSQDTKVYGEGYSMLSQYEGSIHEQHLIGQYSDRDHYKLKQRDGFHTVYNYAVFSNCLHGKAHHSLIGFSSCRKFNGSIRYQVNNLQIVLDAEGLTLQPGQSWQLEELVWLEGEDLQLLYDQFAHRISIHHPVLPWSQVPTGWCSWYCFGPDVTEEDICSNMDRIAEQNSDLKFIQIDDGYQAYMGDWLIPHPSFSGGISALCLSIKNKGFEPAIWVAPFIAQAESKLFQEHPDWFVRNEQGDPLLSSEISFGGWRCGPWYMLDGSHPGARSYLKNVFQTMKEIWKCKYFKLDANVWGALHGGYHYDPTVTRIEAYRLGMQAILEAVGDDTFLLGCNAPMWPSLGLVHGMRVTDDISREWKMLTLVARQCFHRNWQHRRLWINDPDCLVLDNGNVALPGPDGLWRIAQSELTDDEFLFHATYIVASGGMVLSGDDLTKLNDNQWNFIRKTMQTPKQAAIFEDRTFTIGRIVDGNITYVCVFNWSNHEMDYHIAVDGPAEAKEFWTEEVLVVKDLGIKLKNVPAQSARIVMVTSVKHSA